MRAVVTADLHYDLLSPEDRAGLRAWVGGIMAAQPGVFIIAGDTVGLGKKYLPETLALFAALPCPKFIVPGNHDLWVPEGESLEYIKGRYTCDVEAAGFKRLELGPFVAGECAVIGAMGWYDYSFRDPAIREDRTTSYRRKMFRGRIARNDGVFVHLPVDDATFSAWEIGTLTGALASLPASVTRVLAVTHMLAFQELLPAKAHDDDSSFSNAFQGSRRLGDVLLADLRVKYHVFGHTHAPGRATVDSLTAISVGATYDAKEFVVADL